MPSANSCTLTRPRPPPSNARHVDAKRFTLRDGFHLKDRNDEKRVEIDHAIAADDSIAPQQHNQTSDPRETRKGPTSNDVDSNSTTTDTEIAKIFDFLQRSPPQLAVNDPSHAHSPVVRTSSAGGSPTKPHEGMEAPPLSSAYRQAEAAVILSRLQPSSDWLIYRHRAKATPRRKEEQLEKMIHEVLGLKESEIAQPTKPTSRRGDRKRQSTKAAPLYGQSSIIPGLGLALGAIASTENGVNGLTFRRGSTDTVLFATERSQMRDKTAVPLKTAKLLGRMDEFRTFPAVVERVLQENREQRHERILLHGENLVQKNKTHHLQMPPLQRPPHTPVFPSLVEHKRYQALKRKQLVDENEELTLKTVVNRWQNRRVEIQEQERRQYVQSQWVLIAVLGQATENWRKKFRELKVRRDTIVRLAMIKKIQRYWKQQQLLRKNATAVLSMPADSPLRGQFYRMPEVLKAIHLVQVGMRRWIASKRLRDNQRRVEIIITSWLEFQDVKFRRLILRFRKRVRDFQTMWRTWRSITDARIKLLLHVWTKVEKKHKRRGGMASHGSQDEAGGDTAYGPGHSQHRETIHRHLRNGGVVLTAVSAMGPSRSPIKSDLHLHVEEDLQFAMRDFYATTGGRHSPTNKLSLSRSHHHQSTSLLPGVSSHGHHPSTSGSPLKSSASTAAMDPWRPPKSPALTEKIPLSLKVSLLRQLLSEKRKNFQANKERKRVEWKERRQQLRRIDFQYNVLDELAAFQRFQAEHAIFLVLRSISEGEIVQLIHTAHQRLSVSTNPHQPASLLLPPSVELTAKPNLGPKSPTMRALAPNAPAEPNVKSRYDGPRRSTMLTIHSKASLHRLPTTLSIGDSFAQDDDNGVKHSG